ncbi:MAG: methionine--tRNA ligase, partial [Pseudomonadota bacterium]
RTGINLAVLFAIVAQPLIPNTAKTILDTLGIPEENRKWPSPDDDGLLDAIPPGLPVVAPPVLFQKIEDAMVEEWTERFGGEET